MRASTMFAALVAVALVAAVAATAAPAATVSASSGRLTFQADPGESNRTTLTWDGSSVQIADPGTSFLLGVGCLPQSLTQVRCPSPSGGPLAALTGCESCVAEAFAGDRDDTVTLIAAPAGVHPSVHGGPGDDRLTANAGSVAGTRAATR